MRSSLRKAIRRPYAALHGFSLLSLALPAGHLTGTPQIPKLPAYKANASDDQNHNLDNFQHHDG